MSILQVRDLQVSFNTPDGVVRAVNGVSFDLSAGSTLAVVGESGSGKSVMASTIMGLTRGRTATVGGSILLGERDVLSATDDELRQMRGNDAAMIFQDPMTALNPYYTVGQQIGSAYGVHHRSASKRERRARAIELMAKVGIPQPNDRVDYHPHEFSGGMRQRIVIAIALANDPRVLIADEPTTALDVTVQAQILDLMKTLQQETGTAIILITHDLGVVAEVADDVLVMYAGRAVETATCSTLFAQPTHPYTWGLMGAVKSLGRQSGEALSTITGSPPSMVALPPGCAFAPRCAHAASRCAGEVPVLRRIGERVGETACHLDDAALLMGAPS